jgi:integrase
MPRKKVEARKATHHGKKCWRIIIPIELGGGVKYFPFEQNKEAAAFAASKEQLRRGSIHKIYALTNSQLNTVACAIDFVGWNRLDDLVAAAKSYASHSGAETLEAVAAECITVKTAAGCRARYTEALEATFARFVASLGKDGDKRPMRDLTRQDVETFVNGPKARGGASGMWTRRARLIDVRTLFSFAVARNYCRENLAEKLEKIRLDEKPPAILTVEQADKIMVETRAKYPHLIPFVSLCLFAGLRPSEAQQVRWEDIGGETIEVSADRSKGRRRRLVTVNETLKSWLALKGELPISEPRARVIREIIKPWPKDGLRHSFVSYHYAIHGAAATAREAGHSEQILFQHYRALVTKPQAEAFWGIKPQVNNEIE